MNKYDQLTYYILNRILIMFGVRVVDTDQKKRVVFIHRIKNYLLKETPESVHVIQLSENPADVFGFLNMDYDDYKQQQFKTIFEHVQWLTDNCQYLTLDIVQSMLKEVEDVPPNKRTDLMREVHKFCETVRIGHIILQGFNFIPIIMYTNMREAIVRSFFDDEDVESQFVNLKLRYLKDVELPNKFCPLYIVNWIEELRSRPILTGIFTTSFVNYITGDNAALFPRLLIDVDAAIIRKEVLSYYDYAFQKSSQYKEYITNYPEAEFKKE